MNNKVFYPSLERLYNKSTENNQNWLNNSNNNNNN